MEFPLSAALDDDVLDALRDKSKRLYGNRYRLEVAVAVGRAAETFYLAEIARKIGADDPPVRNILLDMVDAGLLRALKGKRGAAKFYERRPSRYWAMAETMLEELVAGLPAETESGSE